MKKGLIIFLSIILISSIYWECVYKPNKIEKQKVSKQIPESKVKDKHIKILECNKTYEEMTPSERITAVEITENYWNELNKEQQEKYLERKKFILKTKDEAVEKWKRAVDEEKDNSEKVEYEKENINDPKKHTDISSLKFGELINTTINGDTLIIKAKISPSYSNTATINQNGHNIEDIILNQGGDTFNEIQYWAVSDMTDGSESKVISFTLKKKQIDLVKNNKLFGRDIVSQASDVWILPSLKN
ncbi:hypothetical protein [Clostridium perfringens]|uniref:hypothetical protein n=1 Tax=Clostridium perfringens TaxID=1502 RepID=UPI0024BC2D19|nr:hypothetical protein [Clostridium perfringens]